MAKSGEQRQIFGLKCTVCGNVNYVTTRNKINTTEKLGLNKYCKYDRKKTPHKETDKLK